MLRFCFVMLMVLSTINTSWISSKPIIQNEKQEESRTETPEALSAEQQDLKNIQEKLTQDAERNWASYPAFDYKNVRDSIEILDKLVGDSILSLESGIKVFARKTSRNMQVLLSLLDTYPRIAQKIDQSQLKQIRSLLLND